MPPVIVTGQDVCFKRAAADTGTECTARGSDRAAGNRHRTAAGIDGANTGGIISALGFYLRGAANVDGGICGSVAAANGSAVIIEVFLARGLSINIAAVDIDVHTLWGVLTAADASAIPSVRVYFAAMDVDCNLTFVTAIFSGSNTGTTG